ncbi:MAG: tRNA (guanosine(37)-N1)-methyltransferase TrmD [Planctomycetota bacterium]
MPLFTILTLFPEAVESYLDVGILGIARARGLVATRVIDFRDFARDRHRTVDDRPFGGGPGMVLKPEPIVEAVEWIDARYGPHRRLAACPSGNRFDQAAATSLSTSERTLLLCGRYEGFDERIFESLEFEFFSLGDFVLAGGELAALCAVEAAARLVPGALGDDRSAIQESFTPAAEGGLDHPHYTRPRLFRGLAAPDVLLGGDHAAIERWRAQAARDRTRARRPDLGAPTDRPS